MAFLTSSIVKDNILYPVRVEKPSLADFDKFQEKPFVEYLFDTVRTEVEHKGDRTWLTNGSLVATGSSKVFGCESVKISQVETKSRAIAAILYDMYNVRRGDVVHIILPNTTEFYFPVLGTWILQGVVSPADPSLSPQILARQFQDASTKVVFCCLTTLEKTKAAMTHMTTDIPIIVIDMDDDNSNKDESVKGMTSLLNLNLKEPPASKVIEENERTLICWSSGTTGRPKGIQHGSKLWKKFFLENSDETQFMYTTCMFHIGGFVAPITSLIKGSSVVFLAGEDLEKNTSLILEVAEKVSPRLLVCGSHHAIQLANMKLQKDQDPVRSVHILCPLGTNVYDGILEDVKEKFPSLIGVYNIYGQSEIYNTVARSLTQENLGGLHQGVDALKFVDPSTGEAVGPNIVGEFAVKTANVMLGYLNHQEENDHFFGKDGFLYMGDLGHYDEDGVIYFDGRAKDLIKYKNSHLYPMEIEDLIMKLSGVKDAAVFGKPEPSVQELVTAVVVKMEGSAVSADDIVKEVDGKVDDHKKLRGGVIFVDKIPRNAQGKIIRRNILNMVE